MNRGYGRARGRRTIVPQPGIYSSAWVIINVLMVLTLLGAYVWLAVITGIFASRDTGKTEVLNITNVSNITNTSVVGVASLVTASGSVDINSSVNFPFDVIVSDPFGLYDNTSSVWIADRSGYWELIACFTFDQAATSGFPTNLTYDHQIQTFVDNVFPVAGNFFLNIFTSPAQSPTPPAIQLKLCGSAIYLLDEGQNITIRLQTRIYPFTIVNSVTDGGIFVATRASFTFQGELPP